MPSPRFSVLVVWTDGEPEYLKEGSRTASFASRCKAEQMRDFMLVGMEGEVQSISVVPALGVEA